eukprot:SM000042S15318  [mRNA]  locus=s42:365178:366358:+ [translate_table: standard]
MAVFFDAKQLRDNSELRLRELRADFGLVAAAFRKHHPAGSDAANAVFFFEIEFSQAKDVFQRYGISMLPHFRVFGPGRDEPADEMRFDQFDRSLEGIAAFVQHRTNVSIGPVARPPPISKQALGIIVAVLVIAAPYVGTKLMTIRTPLHDARLWALAGVVIYWFSVSGGMYNIIRGMPMFMQDRERPGKVVYFFKGSGAQLGTEGFTSGGLYCSVGLILAAATHLVPRIQSKTVQRVVMGTCLVVAYGAARQLLELNKWKQGGYWAHAYWPRGWR